MQGQPSQQVFGTCQFLEGYRIVWMLAQVALEALMRLLDATMAAVRARVEPEAQAAGLQLRHA